jgi:hypothetical protein
VLIQVTTILYPAIGWGQGAINNTIIVLMIGFPVWIVFTYMFEWTPSGLKKTVDVDEETSIAKSTGKKMNGIIIAGLTLAVLFLVADRIFNFTEKTNNDKSIAVLAFADMSPNKDQEYFSDGISEEILNLLTKIPDLKVISRTSSFSTFIVYIPLLFWFDNLDYKLYAIFIAMTFWIISRGALLIIKFRKIFIPLSQKA